MIPELVVTASLSLAGPASSGPPASADAPGLELVAQVEEGYLLLVNPTPHARVVALDPGRGSGRVVLVLPPFGELEERFPRGTLDGLRLELAPATVGAVAPALELGALQDEGFEAVWIESAGDHAHAWGSLQLGAVQVPVHSGSSGHGPAGSYAPSLGCGTQPVHVPVITPGGKRKISSPPAIRRKPLPPV